MPRSRSRRNTGRLASSYTRLRAQYLAAHYVVRGSEVLMLTVGRRSGRLLELHRRHAVHRSAFLTACNPRSRRRSAVANDRAQQQLLALLRQRGYACLPGHGMDSRGAWPAEESVLVLGISAAEAGVLARRFAQNALLVMGADAVPRLVWVRPEPSPTA